MWKSAARNFDGQVKSHLLVIPAKAGIRNLLKKLDAGFRRHDGQWWISTFTVSSTLGNTKPPHPAGMRGCAPTIAISALKCKTKTRIKT
jgi:hypothetical protein